MTAVDANVTNVKDEQHTKDQNAGKATPQPNSKTGGRNQHPTSITRIGQGLVSCLQVPELQQWAGRLQSVCLHGNNITRIEGLQQLTALKELNLSSNSIVQVEGLSNLGSLTSLNLASNRLSGALSSLAGLSSLTHLNLAYNNLTSLAGLGDLQGPNSKLRVLNVKHNLLGSLQHCAVLAGCISLRDLSVAGNPISQLPNYRQAILSVLPHITQLDNLTSQDALSAAFDVQAAQSVAAAKLLAFQPASNTMSPAPSPSHISPAMASPLSGSPARPTSSPAVYNTAQVQPTLRPASQVHHQYAALSDMDVGHQVLTVHSGGMVSQPAQGRLPARQSGRSTGPAVTGRPSSWQQSSSHTDQHVQGRATGVQRVYLKDAAVQATDVSDQAGRVARSEAEHLKQQLLALTDELEKRNQDAEEMRQQLANAMQAVEEEAHQRVEEGYREASQAVRKALSELEAVRQTAHEAQQRADVLGRREEELRSHISQLDKELSRAKEEVCAGKEAVQQAQVKAGQTLDAQRARWQEAEEALRQQLQAAEQQLAAAKAAGAASEQRIAALEVSLQQSSNAAMNMTGKIAQVMADSTTQLDALRAKLAAAEQSLLDAGRREAELKAEVSMLTTNITMLQQRYAQELEHLRKQHNEQYERQLSQQVAVAEERGRSAALLQVQVDRGTLLEQLAFLKAQLQFALKEGEKESGSLQEQLVRAQDQLQELQAALQASAAKQREHEGLVTDLSNVVGQQKLHIQSLQKERDSLVAQLRAAGPEQLQRLAAEAAGLRAAAAEANVMREQADHSRRQWQDAERRLAEAQARSARQVEELSQRVASLETSLGNARQEVKAAAAQIEQLNMQLAAAQDAVKVKTAMVDSAHDTVASLKAELQEMHAELEDARRALEDMELSAAKQAEADAAEKASLRSEIEAGEAALEAMSSSVAGVDSKVRAAESRAVGAENRAKALEQQLADKDGLIKYVEEEVERVKGLYEQREARLRDERDAARTAAAAAAAAKEAMEARLSEHAVKLDLTAAELQAEHQACQAATDACQRAQAEVVQLTARLAETEDELKALLAAVERQKASSAVKMRQLATLLSDMG